MRFTTSELARALGGTLVGPDTSVTGVSTDTRTLEEGQLFVPLVDRNDGHDFLGAAVAAGAPAYLTAGPLVDGATAVVIGDPAAALLALGAYARDRLPDAVVGITGSVGKTTVKELTAGVLATTFATAASAQSFNNEIGVPLTLANAPEGTEATVVEMGARGPGHIRALCAVARPTVGVVTRVGEAHTAFFWDLDAVADAKAELVEALPPGGTAILNADDPKVAAMAGRTEARVVHFGLLSDAEVTARDVVFDALARPSFTLCTPEGSVDIALVVHGHHQVANALAAAAAARSVGVPLSAIPKGLAAVGAPTWRMDTLATRSGAVVVNDAYNANPTSVRAALEALAQMQGRRRVVVLGAMAELGDGSSEHHRAICTLADALGIEVVAYRTADYGPDPVADPRGVVARLKGCGPGDLVLVKGSRAAQMEEVAAALIDALGGAV